jgi:integrase
LLADFLYSGSTHNHLTVNISLIFELAFNDGYLAENPCNRVNKTLKTKKIVKKQTPIPTEQQFRALLDHLRTFYVTADRQELADVVEFFALASIGEAEALALRWEDIDWAEDRIHVKRVKTSQVYSIPFYAWLRPFLVNLWERRGRPTHGQIFSVKNVFIRLKNACQTLKTPRLTSRSLRKFGITKLLRAGLPVKNISAYQGHQDGGKLIWNTYSEVIAEDSRAYERKLIESLKW